jgi:hypothetical protein
MTRTTIFRSQRFNAAIGTNPPSVSGRLTTIADRYLEILRRARIEQRFSESEMNALRDCCNGCNGMVFEPAVLIDGAILANFRDAALDSLSEKWGIDGESVAQKLASLSYPEQIALVESIEQWWRAQCPDGPTNVED